MRTISEIDLALRLPQERDIMIMAHENPDGDAVGCVVALMLMARQLGVSHRVYLPGDTPISPEYSFLLDLQDIERGEFPQVHSETTVYIMDSASASRLDVSALHCAGDCINIDHHQDNDGYGTLNLIDPSAASTTQILFNIFRAGDLPIGVAIGTALYVGLVTDTGRFQYSNTTPEAHRMAAYLQEAGVDVNQVFSRVYERTPLPKTRLLAIALNRLSLLSDGALAVSSLNTADFAAAGADERHTEGIIDELRRIEGVKVAAFVRERASDDGTQQKVSLRSTDGSVDVASIAHLKGGGGHVRAAGFTTDGDVESVVAWIEREVKARL